MKVITNLYAINFDYTAFRKKLHDFMVETTKEAARSWLRTVLIIIPTWSRASRATFEALANEVGYNVTYGPIKSNVDRLLLGMSTGEGGLKISKLNTYEFWYSTSLEYLEYNNFNKATPGPYPQPFGRLKHSTPYKFLEAGEKDFHSFVSTIKLPSPISFVTKRKI